jgi:hypothetical protein
MIKPPLERATPNSVPSRELSVALTVIASLVVFDQARPEVAAATHQFRHVATLPYLPPILPTRIPERIVHLPGPAVHTTFQGANVSLSLAQKVHFYCERTSRFTTEPSSRIWKSVAISLREGR